jgi:hypothetical protein
VSSAISLCAAADGRYAALALRVVATISPVGNDWWEIKFPGKEPWSVIGLETARRVVQEVIDDE